MNSAPKPIEPSNNLQSCFIYIRGGEKYLSVELLSTTEGMMNKS